MRERGRVRAARAFVSIPKPIGQAALLQENTALGALVGIIPAPNTV
jgi:hypothetical protein